MNLVQRIDGLVVQERCNSDYSKGVTSFLHLPIEMLIEFTDWIYQMYRL